MKGQPILAELEDLMVSNDKYPNWFINLISIKILEIYFCRNNQIDPKIQVEKPQRSLKRGTELKDSHFLFSESPTKLPWAGQCVTGIE